MRCYMPLVQWCYAKAIYKPLCSTMLCWTQLLQSELNGNWDMQPLLYIHTTINTVVQPSYSEHLKCTNPYVHSCDARRNFYIKIHGRLTSTNNYVHSRYAKRSYASQFIANTWDVQTLMCIHATLNATCTANVMCELDIYKPVCSFMIR